MRVIKLLLTMFAIVSTMSIGYAQESVENIVKEWQRAKEYTKEYLDAMPDEGYAFKPTPEMRSFAEQMLHLTDANYGFVAGITGTKSPIAEGSSEKTTDKSKANVTKLVLAGYDQVIASIQKFTPAQLAEKVKIFGSFELSRNMAYQKAFEHQTHHRGQTTVYLRLKGVKPPQEKLF